MNKENSNEIFVQLLADEEGTNRPTQGIPLGNNLYKILPISDYETADEVWEFLPGTIVRCEERSFRGEIYLLAVEKVG